MSEKKIFLRRTHLGSQILFHFGILFHFQTLFIIIKKYFNTFSIFFHHFFSSKSLFFSFFILFSVISTKLTHLHYVLHISLCLFALIPSSVIRYFFHLWILLVLLHFFRSCLVNQIVVSNMVIQMLLAFPDLSRFIWFYTRVMIIFPRNIIVTRSNV